MSEWTVGKRLLLCSILFIQIMFLTTLLVVSTGPAIYDANYYKFVGCCAEFIGGKKKCREVIFYSKKDLPKIFVSLVLNIQN